MRELHECQAEVFRRSEERIKERKQRRNHLIMACLPLVLCITLFSAFFLPGMLPGETRDPGVADGAVGGLTENKSESITCAYAKIDVIGNGISLSYTKASDVLSISNQLASYVVNEPESNTSVGETTRGDDFKNESAEDGYIGTTGTTAAAGTGYVITLTLHEGGTIVYRLTDNSLLDLAENKTYKLTQAQLKDLNELLGIK